MKTIVRSIIIYWFKIQAAKAARIILIQHYTHKECKKILLGYWQRYLIFKSEISYMPTLGGSIMVHLAAMSIGYYNELTSRGQKEEITIAQFYEIAWNIYAKLGKISWWIVGWGERNDYNRLMKATLLFRKFPFNSPSYDWENVQSGPNSISFNCKKCPAAEYFAKYNLSAFCVKTWCALDFPLAELWHSKLERTGSIASGADKCDFIWVVNPKVKNYEK